HEVTGISGANTTFDLISLNEEDPDLTVFNGKVLFAGLDTANQIGLWVTDGTAAGTHEITGISGANATGLLQFPGGTGSPDFTVFNGEALFNGVDAHRARGLWETAGTAPGTPQLHNHAGA